MLLKQLNNASQIILEKQNKFLEEFKKEQLKREKQKFKNDSIRTKKQF